jgi:hypothetical protein
MVQHKLTKHPKGFWDESINIYLCLLIYSLKYHHHRIMLLQIMFLQVCTYTKYVLNNVWIVCILTRLYLILHKYLLLFINKLSYYLCCHHNVLANWSSFYVAKEINKKKKFTKIFALTWIILVLNKA